MLQDVGLMSWCPKMRFRGGLLKSSIVMPNDVICHWDTHMNQLNKAREKLITYEKKGGNLRGLDELITGIEILVEYLKSDDIPDHKIIAKQLVITYRRDSLVWIKGALKNYSDDVSELWTLNYCNELMNAFEGANKLIGPGSEFDHLKQLIEQKLAEIGPLDIDTLVFGIRKLSDEERSQIISLLEKMGIHIKSRM